MLEIYTSTIRSKDPDVMDITMKSGRRYFAPTPEMVWGVKRGTMTWDEYTRLYEDMMEQNRLMHPQPIHLLLARERVVLVCYCPTPEQCHRSLLAKWLVMHWTFKCVYKGEI